MNNILTFEDYRKMNIRQVESVIYRQFIEENITEESVVNEGAIRNAINKMASNFIQTALADEIEKGKELEKSIKEALDGLDKGFEEIKKSIDKKSKDSSKLNAIEKVKEAIKAVQSQAFDTLTMIGSEGEIDFAGFMGSGTIAAATNFGILFTPIRSLFITRKAYKYFLGIIKQTIRRNLLIIQLNFDQFENLILQKSFETDEDSETLTKSNTLHDVISTLQAELCGKDSKMFKKSKSKEMKDYLEAFKKAQDIAIKQNRENAKNNPLRSLWEDQHNNTYTRTLEQIKQYINDDSQKELDSLKNSITKMAGNDVELVQFGELMIAAAEEYAIHTNHGINNNFIKMSSVFNLENQKKLIEMIVATQKENEEEIKKKLKNKELKEIEEKLENTKKEGKKIYEEKLKDKEDDYDTFDEFEKEFEDNDVECLKAFFDSEEGKDIYKELIKKKPLYKYLIMNDTTFNTFLSSISNLEVVEISDNISKFFENIIGEKNALYYLMAERSIKDAVDSKDSDDYFGLLNTGGKVEATVDGNILISKNVRDILSQDFLSPKRFRDSDIEKRYFLTFDTDAGNNLFDVLHDFETEIFDGNKYKNDISTDSKQAIINIINKNLNIDKSVTKKLAAYLVRLEAHMSLVTKDPFFVIKNKEELFDNGCFGDVENLEFSNKNAFVEIKKEHYDDIKKFLYRLKELNKNDFNIETEKKEEENK